MRWSTITKGNTLDAKGTALIIPSQYCCMFLSDVLTGKSVDASTPSGRSTMTSSPSMRGLDPGVEADLTNRICHTSALTVLQGLPSSFEKEQLLSMLADMEVSECCTWPSSLR